MIVTRYHQIKLVPFLACVLSAIMVSNMRELARVPSVLTKPRWLLSRETILESRYARRRWKRRWIEDPIVIGRQFAGSFLFLPGFGIKTLLISRHSRGWFLLTNKILNKAARTLLLNRDTAGTVTPSLPGADLCQPQFLFCVVPYPSFQHTWTDFRYLNLFLYWVAVCGGIFCAILCHTFSFFTVVDLNCSAWSLNNWINLVLD